MSAVILMILKMSVATAVCILLTCIMWALFKDRKMNIGMIIAVGVIFGLFSVASTHHGVDHGMMIINVRDLGPMAAGLFFNPVSGIIAGLIGGVERYIAGTYYDIGAFTTLACSVSTCLAGFLAAFLNIVVFQRKKPTVEYAFFMGAVIEVFHMYAIYLTHHDDTLSQAFTVVRICSPPMIIFSGIGLGVIAIIIRIMEGDNPFKPRPRSQIPVLHTFNLWLFFATAMVFLVTVGLNYSLQTRAEMSEAKAELASSEKEITSIYENAKGTEADISKMSIAISNDGIYEIIDKEGDPVAGSYKIDRSDQMFELFGDNPKDGFFNADYYGFTCIGTIKTLSDGEKLIVLMMEDSVFESRDMQFNETILADILLFTVIFLLISMLVQSLVMSNLIKVNRSLNKITQGDLNERIDVFSSAEFALLSEDINMTVDALKGYIEAAEKRNEQELMLAKTIQESALPHNFDFSTKSFDLYASMEPAREVGGDFYDFFFMDQDKFALVIADVSDKGIPAALFMMQSKRALHGLCETGKTLHEGMKSVNEELCRGNDVDMFVTVWMGIVDLKTGVVNCVNAGHEYPAIRRRGGDYKLLRDRHGLPLGAMEGIEFHEYEIKLEPGDCIYVYTDGVPDALNSEKEQYGTKRMLNALNMNKDCSMEELLPAVKRDLDEFAGGEQQFDDVTMLGFRYEGYEQ